MFAEVKSGLYFSKFKSSCIYETYALTQRLSLPFVFSSSAFLNMCQMYYEPFCALKIEKRLETITCVMEHYKIDKIFT